MTRAVLPAAGWGRTFKPPPDYLPGKGASIVKDTDGGNDARSLDLGIPSDKPRFNVVIVSPAGYAHSAAFFELAETLVHGLRSLDCEAGISLNSYSPVAANIFLGAHLISRSMAGTIPRGSIIYNTEQVFEGSRWMRTELPHLIETHETWDYSRRNIELLADRIPASVLRYVPIGFVPQLARIEKAPLQDIDVLFYGSMSDRRAQIIEDLRSRNLNVAARMGCYGKERDALIARSKVVLNVHYYESKIFEIVRVSYLLTNRKAVVAEMDRETAMDPIYRDAVAGVPYALLADTCAAMASDDARRVQLEERGFQIMSSISEADCLRAAVGQFIRNPAKNP